MLAELGIGVATGEMCQNRVMFKQLLQAEAIDFCQIDSCRLGGVNEVLAVMLMAAKFGVPVCPHAGTLCYHHTHVVVLTLVLRFPLLLIRRRRPVRVCAALVHHQLHLHLWDLEEHSDRVCGPPARAL